MIAVLRDGHHPLADDGEPASPSVMDLNADEQAYYRKKRHYCSACQMTGMHALLCPERDDDD